MRLCRVKRVLVLAGNPRGRARGFVRLGFEIGDEIVDRGLEGICLWFNGLGVRPSAPPANSGSPSIAAISAERKDGRRRSGIELPVFRGCP